MKNMGKSTVLLCRELCCYTGVDTPPQISFQEGFLIVKVDCFTASKTKALLKHIHFRTYVVGEYNFAVNARFLFYT